jgi:hypothetical protein
MNTKPQLKAEENPFAEAEEKFSALTAELLAVTAANLSHSEAEELVEGNGREVLRALLQGYLQMRSLDEVGPVVVGSDAVARSHLRVRSVSMVSVLGEVQIVRQTYGARGAASVAPLDSALNLPNQRYSFGVIKRVAEEAATGSYDDAIDTVSRLNGIHVPKRQAEQITAACAVDFDAFYEQRAQAEAPASLDDAAGMLILTTDGKGIVMRHDSLTDKTRQAAESAVPRLETRQSKGEKANRKRMAQVASVYCVAPWARVPEDFMRDLRPIHDVATQRPKPVKKRLWASVKKPMEGVIIEMFDEALRRDSQRSKTWVGLVDGNPFQLGDLLAGADMHQVKLVVIIDIIHVIEYLWKAAWCFFKEGDRAAEAWVSERQLEVLRGNCSQVAKGIRRMATCRNLSPGERKGADKCSNYLLKYKEYMQYNKYLAAGMPIATGVIEGACRYLVKDRMDITGARWGLDGAEAVLKLRALRVSGDLVEYWKFHQQQELQRNHLCHYADNKIPSFERQQTSAPKKPKLQLVK